MARKAAQAGGTPVDEAWVKARLAKIVETGIEEGRLDTRSTMQAMELLAKMVDDKRSRADEGVMPEVLSFLMATRGGAEPSPTP